MTRSDDGSDAEMDQLRLHALERHSFAFIGDRALQRLFDYLNHLKIQHLEAERYLAAGDASELMEQCRAEIHSRTGISPRTYPPRDPTHTATGQQLSKYDRRIQDHEDRLREKLANLAVKHQQELDAFETEWREVIPERYRRPSKVLMDMRHFAHNLAVGSRFEDAQARKEEADNQAEKELQAAQERLNNDYARAKKRLLATQREEVNQVQETALQQRELLFTLRTATEQAFSNRMLVLDTKPTVWTKGGPPPQASTKSSGVRNSPKRTAEFRLPPLQPPGLFSPPTRSPTSARPDVVA
jgi:hypothetical protein